MVSDGFLGVSPSESFAEVVVKVDDRAKGTGEGRGLLAKFGLLGEKFRVGAEVFTGDSEGGGVTAEEAHSDSTF